jgi:hypothetical protein
MSRFADAIETLPGDVGAGAVLFGCRFGWVGGAMGVGRAATLPVWLDGAETGDAVRVILDGEPSPIASKSISELVGLEVGLDVTESREVSRLDTLLDENGRLAGEVALGVSRGSSPIFNSPLEIPLNDFCSKAMS